MNPPLAHISTADEERLTNLRIKDVYVASLYFYTRVRYPHGTRSETHGRDGFHTLSDAMHFVEFRRRQGTGFLIHQLPALLLVSNSYCVAIAQIETSAPLAKYSPFAIRRNKISDKRGTLSLRKATIRIGGLLGEAVASFVPNDDYWFNPRPSHYSIVRLISRRDTPEFERLPRMNLVDHKSSPPYDPNPCGLKWPWIGRRNAAPSTPDQSENWLGWHATGASRDIWLGVLRFLDESPSID